MKKVISILSILVCTMILTGCNFNSFIKDISKNNLFYSYENSLSFPSKQINLSTNQKLKLILIIDVEKRYYDTIILSVENIKVLELDKNTNTIIALATGTTKVYAKIPSLNLTTFMEVTVI